MSEKTLELIEWPQLCQHLSMFAATRLGALASEQLSLSKAVDQSRHLLAQTEEVVRLEVEYLHTLKFDGVADIGESLQRSEIQGVLSGEALWQIATTLSGARTLRRTIDKHADLVVLRQLVSELRTYPELETEISRCIDEQGEVMERASERLGSLRRTRIQVHRQVQDILQRILQRKAQAVQENLITQRSERFVIPVKAPRKDEIPGIVHDVSTSGATLYIEPRKTVELNNQLRQLQRQEQIECEAIRRALSEKVSEVREDLEHLLFTVTTLDLAVARARYSLAIGGHCPKWGDRNEGQSVVLRQLSHPLLIWQAKKDPSHSVVPVDLVIRPDLKVVAITGPNTGGKTVTLKTLALAIAMAKAGLFIPAKPPIELPWFDQVLADIGDEQSLEQSLSTFSGHVKRIQYILTQLTDQSLILLDEVGAGTDPLEGSALAIALLNYLADHAQLTVATTHFGELKTLKYKDSRFENASVEFDDRSLAPTYRLLWGIPGRSNALIIAERLGFNVDIIQNAQAALGDEADEFNQVISDLELQRRKQEDKAQKATQLLASTEKLHGQLTQKASELRSREQKIKQQQEQELQQELLTAKQEIARVIHKLQKGPQTAKSAHNATQTLAAIAQKQQPVVTKPKPLGYQPKLGDRIRIPKLGHVAEVISLVGESGEMTVRFGMMKMTVRLEDIESLDGQKAEPVVKVKPVAKLAPEPPNEVPMIRTAQNTIDIRGQRVSEAERILEDAIAHAMGPLWIIHGHGTGKLRNGVQEYLKTNTLVQRYEFAEQNEGGRGVTIAYCG